MGGLSVEVKYTRVRDGEPHDALLEGLWARITDVLARVLRKDDPGDSVYLSEQVDQWTSSEGLLTYVFMDMAGCCHASMYAYGHWTERALVMLADDPDELADKLGIRLMLDRSREQLLVADELLYRWRERLYVVEAGARGVRLVGDMSDVEGGELSPKVRAEVKTLLQTRACPCPMCGALRARPPARAPRKVPKRSAAGDVGGGGDASAALLKMLRDPKTTPSRVAKVAREGQLPAAARAVLAGRKDYDRVRHAMALDPKTSPAVLEELSRDEWDKVRLCVAGHPACPPSALAALASAKDEDVRRRIAANPSTPVPTLLTLARDRKSTVLSSLAENPKVPAAIFSTLAKHRDLLVRYQLAQNPAVSAEALAILARDEDESIRRTVAGSPRATSPVLKELAKHEDTETRAAVALNSITPPDLLEVLARDEDEDVRASVAFRLDTPPATLSELASDRSLQVRHTLTNNRATPTEAIRRLSKDRDRGVRDSARWALEGRR